MTQTRFRIHYELDDGDQVRREAATFAAISPAAASQQLLTQKAFTGARIIKIKRVKQ